MFWAMKGYSHKPHESDWWVTGGPCAACWTLWSNGFRIYDSEQAEDKLRIYYLSKTKNCT
jgi:hypothetical protein